MSESAVWFGLKKKKSDGNENKKDFFFPGF